MGLGAFCAGLLLASLSLAQAAELSSQYAGQEGQYAYASYPYGPVCLTYPTYPLPEPPGIFSYDYGCPVKNMMYHPNHRTIRLVYPGALGAYTSYYYDWTDPLDHVTAPLWALTLPVKALSTPPPEAEAGAMPLAPSETVAAVQMGRLCATPVKTCGLEHAAYVGSGCSCRVPGGRARGSVAP